MRRGWEERLPATTRRGRGGARISHGQRKPADQGRRFHVGVFSPSGAKYRIEIASGSSRGVLLVSRGMRSTQRETGRRRRAGSHKIDTAGRKSDPGGGSVALTNQVATARQQEGSRGSRSRSSESLSRIDGRSTGRGRRECDIPERAQRSRRCGRRDRATAMRLARFVGTDSLDQPCR